MIIRGLLENYIYKTLNSKWKLFHEDKYIMQLEKHLYYYKDIINK